MEISTVSFCCLKEASTGHMEGWVVQGLHCRVLVYLSQAGLEQRFLNFCVFESHLAVIEKEILCHSSASGSMDLHIKPIDLSDYKFEEHLNEVIYESASRS